MLHAREDYQRIQDPDGKIGADEPVFLVRAQDRHFIEMLLTYQCLIRGDPDADYVRFHDLIEEHILRAKEWQAIHGKKTPDLPPVTP